ncbi:uncharacterized protein BO97DRAFT_422357 [Aspergillus homomorphus CBS 101889]|uniref:Ankyrin n=1 Tax=Aspergillus homomorphus (strain CBS 101889) TaxID=1450537 RepID=A0A395I480_ASPHC|nr:hypothetical protein BO97DRAFT_422357 [Aspergillus homomorphus CBS 101889]RAL15011.1 hypothetical protein BO97DRAFT_422357 [Aspergillus homomorphus CBS 101889]
MDHKGRPGSPPLPGISDLPTKDILGISDLLDNHDRYYFARTCKKYYGIFAGALKEVQDLYSPAQQYALEKHADPSVALRRAIYEGLHDVVKSFVLHNHAVIGSAIELDGDRLVGIAIGNNDHQTARILLDNGVHARQGRKTRDGVPQILGKSVYRMKKSRFDPSDEMVELLLSYRLEWHWDGTFKWLHQKGNEEFLRQALIGNSGFFNLQ